MIEVESQASDESLLWFVFNREPPEGEQDRDASLELVGAIVAFLGEWISPLTASVRVESCDPANYYSQESSHPPALEAWFLRRQELNSRLLFGPSWNASREKRVLSIGASELMSAAEELLAQPPPLAHLEVALVEIRISAAEIALPDDVVLKLKRGDSQLDPILIRDGRRFLAQGPDYNFFGPPVTLRAHNDHGAAEIVVEFCWDFWRKHPAGLAQVRAAIERVLGRDRDWQITEGNLPA